MKKVIVAVGVKKPRGFNVPPLASMHPWKTVDELVPYISSLPEDNPTKIYVVNPYALEGMVYLHKRGSMEMELVLVDDDGNVITDYVEDLFFMGKNLKSFRFTKDDNPFVKTASLMRKVEMAFWSFNRAHVVLDKLKPWEDEDEDE